MKCARVLVMRSAFSDSRQKAFSDAFCTTSAPARTVYIFTCLAGCILGITMSSMRDSCLFVMLGHWAPYFLQQACVFHCIIQSRCSCQVTLCQFVVSFTNILVQLARQTISSCGLLLRPSPRALSYAASSSGMDAFELAIFHHRRRAHVPLPSVNAPYLFLRSKVKAADLACFVAARDRMVQCFGRVPAVVMLDSMLE